MAAEVKEIFILSMAVASVSFTVSEAIIFKAIRKFISNKNKFLGKLISCGYCLGHWISFSLVAIYQPRLFYSAVPIFDYFITALVIVWISAFQWLIMCWFIKKTGK